jgi:hypothetical protein
MKRVSRWLFAPIDDIVGSGGRPGTLHHNNDTTSAARPPGKTTAPAAAAGHLIFQGDLRQPPVGPGKLPAAMSKPRLKRWGSTALEWVLRTLQEIANNLGSFFT